MGPLTPLSAPMCLEVIGRLLTFEAKVLGVHSTPKACTLSIPRGLMHGDMWIPGSSAWKNVPLSSHFEAHRCVLGGPNSDVGRPPEILKF